MFCFRKMLIAWVCSVSCIVTAAVWADEPYFFGIGQLPSKEMYSRANAISGNGAVVVGTSREGSTNYRAISWTIADGLTPLPLGVATRMESHDASFDGSRITGLIAGGPFGQRGFVWSSLDGVTILPGITLNANGISGNGLVVVGAGGDCTRPCNFGWYRWTEGGGLESVDVFPEGFHSEAMAVSIDGTVVAGTAGTATTTWSAFRWTPSTGSILIGYLPGGTESSVVDGMSPDGDVIVGHSGSTDSNGCCEAFRWSESFGMTGLGFIPGGNTYSQAWSSSRAGTVIVGSARENASIYNAAVVWSRCAGIQRVQDILETHWGLDLSGWQLRGAYDVSDSGLTIVGTGINPSGTEEGWVAHLPCIPGDGNRDGLINGQDIGVFANAIGTVGSDTDDLTCSYDSNNDGVIDADDIAGLVGILLCDSR